MHPGQLSATRADRVHEAVVLDPRRAALWRHNPILMRAEYVVAFFDLVRRSPLSRAAKIRCYGRLVRWGLSKLPGLGIRDARARDVVIEPYAGSIETRGDPAPGSRKQVLP